MSAALAVIGMVIAVLVIGAGGVYGSLWYQFSEPSRLLRRALGDSPHGRHFAEHLAEIRKRIRRLRDLVKNARASVSVFSATRSDAALREAAAQAQDALDLAEARYIEALRTVHDCYCNFAALWVLRMAERRLERGAVAWPKLERELRKLDSQLQRALYDEWRAGTRILDFYRRPEAPAMGQIGRVIDEIRERVAEDAVIRMKIALESTPDGSVDPLLEWARTEIGRLELDLYGVEEISRALAKLNSEIIDRCAHNLSIQSCITNKIFE